MRTSQRPLQTVISPLKRTPSVGSSGVYRVQVEAEDASDPTQRFEIFRDVIAKDARSALLVFGKESFEGYNIQGFLGVRFLREYVSRETL